MLCLLVSGALRWKMSLQNLLILHLNGAKSCLSTRQVHFNQYVERVIWEIWLQYVDDHFINQSNDQSINQSINRSVNYSINQSVNRWINQHMNHCFVSLVHSTNFSIIFIQADPQRIMLSFCIRSHLHYLRAFFELLVASKNQSLMRFSIKLA